MIVPFKNEEDRIVALLYDINELEIPEDLEVEFLFVDDHSSDQTDRYLAEKLAVDFKQLTNEGKGKKAAIRTGVNAAQHDLILTWDADISVPKHYFQELCKLPEADMWILPIEMRSKSFLGRLVSVDFSWLQMLTHVFSQWKSPFLSNGANLLFKKEAFIEAERIRNDYHIPSGDDIFLLRRFLEMDKDVRSAQSKCLIVQTDAPSNMAEIISQRKRWAGKMKGMIDAKGGILLFYLVLVMAVFFTVMIEHIFFMSWTLLLIPLAFKFFSEYILLRFYKGSKDFIIDIPVVFVHQFFFPLYLITLLVTKRKEDSRWDLGSEKN